MKTLVSSLLVALFVTASTVSFARTDDRTPRESKTVAAFKVGVYPSVESTKLNVLIAKETGADISVQLRNEQGYVLATQWVSKKETSCRLRFDLSELEDGKYQVVVSDGTTKTVKEMNLATKTPVQVDRLISLN